MASYKIYFLNFCYKKESPTVANSQFDLQNAIKLAVFIRKGPKRRFSPCLSASGLWNNQAVLVTACSAVGVVCQLVMT